MKQGAILKPYLLIGKRSSITILTDMQECLRQVNFKTVRYASKRYLLTVSGQGLWQKKECWNTSSNFFSKSSKKHLTMTCYMCGDAQNTKVNMSTTTAKIYPVWLSRYHNISGKCRLKVRNDHYRTTVSPFNSQHSNYSSTSHNGDIPARSSPPWRILFLGSDSFANVTLKALNENKNSKDGRVVDELEVVAPNDSKSDVRRYAKQSGLHVHKWPVDVQYGRFDVGVVVSFGKLIPGKLIKSMPYGILNVHASLLPRWKGAAPIAHTVWNDDKVTGVTIMKIRPKHFDTGPMLLQKEVPVPENITTVQLGELLAPIGANMIIQTLSDLINLEKNATEQPVEGTTLAPKVTMSVGYVDFVSQTCTEIYRQYRALCDKVPILTEYQGYEIKLLEMKLQDWDEEFYTLIQRYFDKQETDIPAGSMFRYKRPNLLMVKCKDGWVGFNKIAVKRPSGWKSFIPSEFNRQYIKKNEPFVFSKPKLIDLK